MIRPPLPLPSAIVDPRVGDLGPALLALADGTVFPGIAFGAPLAAGGDLVVNTSQTGYQEVCTDPSYAGQVVAMTYPLIGNYGRLRDDDQSERPWLRALVVANATAAVVEPPRPARGAPPRRRDPGDRRDRHAGAGPPPADARLDPRHRDRARRGRRGTPPWRPPGRCRAGRTRTSSISCRPRRRARSAASGEGGPLVAIVDYGLKANIVRSLRRRGARVRVLPHTVASADALAADVDGLVLSPGPGDPSRLAGPVALARAAIADGRPLLGICLGHQIVGRAAGAETRRLRFGHHGANHPVRDVDTGRVQVTAQNHEVQVVAETLPAGRRLPRQPGQPERRLGGGPPPPRAADRDRPVPPRGRPRPARRARRVRPVRGRVRRPPDRDRVSATTVAPRSVLILGSGPVVIGQAAEFDYAGTQACRALRAEGVRTILVNSNPATIMTDPTVADVVYLEPLTVEAIEAVIARERPEGLLAGLGGQTALNLAVALARAGVLERHDVRLIGTPLEAIEMAEDRERFRALLDRIGQPYAPSWIVEGDTPASREASADAALREIGLPGDRPPGVHARRHRRRDRRDGGGLPGAGPRRAPGQPDRPGHGRALPRRLGRDRVRGHARRRRHVHRGLLDGERRPARRPHRRLDRRRPGPDAARPGPPAAPERVAGDHPGARGRGRLQRPVRAQPGLRGLRGHRGQSAGQPLVGAGQQGDRLSDRPGRRPDRGRPPAGRHPERRDRHDRRRLRAGARLRGRQAAPLPVRQVPDRRPLARQPDEGDRRGHGDRPDVRLGAQQGAPRARAGRRRAARRGPRLGAEPRLPRRGLRAGRDGRRGRRRRRTPTTDAVRRLDRGDGLAGDDGPIAWRDADGNACESTRHAERAAAPIVLRRFLAPSDTRLWRVLALLRRGVPEAVDPGGDRDQPVVPRRVRAGGRPRARRRRPRRAAGRPDRRPRRGAARDGQAGRLRRPRAGGPGRRGDRRPPSDADRARPAAGLRDGRHLRRRVRRRDALLLRDVRRRRVAARGPAGRRARRPS